MTAAPVVVAVLAALVASAAAAAAGSPARPTVAAMVAVIVVFEVFVARHVDSEVGDGTYRRWRRFELLAGLAGIRLLQAITGGAGGLTAPGLGDRETIVAILVFLFARSAANATIDDLAAAESGVSRADDTDPMNRLRSRLLGYGVVCTVCAGYAVLGLGRLFDLGRPAVGAMRVEPMLYVAVSLPALSRVALRAQAARWRRDGASVDQSTGSSWMRTGLTVGAAAVAVTAIVWVMPFGASSVAAHGITRAGPVGEWITDRLAALGDLEPTSTDRRPGETADPLEAFDPAANRTPPWLGEVFFWAFAIGFIAWAARKGGQASRRDRVPPLAGERMRVRQVFRVVMELVRAIWDSLVRFFVRARTRLAAPGAGPPRRRPAEPAPWNPDDPLRRRVAVAYRRSSTHVAQVSGRRRRSETPREYVDRAKVARPTSSGDFGLVTGAYEEARFSDHTLTADHASRVERAADRVEADGGIGPGAG